MAVDRALTDEMLERLEPLGDVTGKAMFGGFGFWEAGDMFALIGSDGRVRFKADDSTKERYEAAGSEPFSPEMPKQGRTMVMPYWTVPADVLGDDDRFDDWAREAIAVGHATSKKKTKTASQRAVAKNAPARKPAAKKKAAVRKRAT